MARVLVTYGWCRSSYVAVRSLAAAGHSVFVCSHLRPAMASWSRFSSDGATVADPFGEPERYAREVAELVNRWAIDLIFPGHEDGLALRRHEDVLPEGVELACPVLGDFELGVDKVEMTRLAARIGVRTPRSAFPKTIDEALTAAADIGYPVVVKARRSNGGKGVRLVHGPDEMRILCSEGLLPFGEGATTFPFIQAFHQGAVVGGCMLAQHGRVVATFGERYLRNKDEGFGTSVYRERMISAATDDALTRLAAALRWTGLAHADFIEDPATGELLFLELNPRPWGAIHLAYVNGFDFAAAAVEQALGGEALQRYFVPRQSADLRSVWLVGEGIRSTVLLRTRGWTAFLRSPWTVLRSLPGARIDGFVWHDPLPLVAEAVCYGHGYFAARGDTNPATRGMFGE